MRKLLFSIALFAALLFFAGSARAEKIVVLYTGETHSDLYPCHCPIEPFGGLARRASKVKELRQAYPNLLLLDSGGFFAGGNLDEYSLGDDLDKQRTDINLQALKIMGYDVLSLGDEEFNFGREFLEKKIADTKLNFISCNVKVRGSQDYLVKKVGTAKIGIIAVTPPEAASGVVRVADPLASIKSAVDKLRNHEKADIIILLSHLGEAADTEILNNTIGIDFVISGHSIFGKDQETKIADSVLLRPAWQGRKLGKLEIEVDKGKIQGYQVDLIGLGQDVPDDPGIKEILPACFSDKDCWKPKFKGACQNPASLNAQCNFADLPKIPFWVVSSVDCRTCNPQPFLQFLKGQFPGLDIVYVMDDNETGKKLIEQFSVTMLPAYFSGRVIEKEGNFSKFKKHFTLKENVYYLNPYFTGVSFFRNREVRLGRLDFFMVLDVPGISRALKTVKNFVDKYKNRLSLNTHFVAIEQNGNFISPLPSPTETQEERRSLCVAKYLPQQNWEYLVCRSENIKSGRWEDCLAGAGEILPKIRECTDGSESAGLLRENIKLTSELEVPYAPLFLLDNQEIFGITEKTTVEELERFIFGPTQNNQ